MTGLTPGKEYLFRVSAVNAEGESKPLEAEQAIVAKNPFGILIKYHSLNRTIKRKTYKKHCYECKLQKYFLICKNL